MYFPAEDPFRVLAPQPATAPTLPTVAPEPAPAGPRLGVKPPQTPPGPRLSTVPGYAASPGPVPFATVMPATGAGDAEARRAFFAERAKALGIGSKYVPPATPAPTSAPAAAPATAPAAAATPAAAPGLVSRLGSVARVGGAALVPLLEGARAAEVAARPDSTMNDAATAVAEGASRTASTFLGGALGAPLGPVGSALGAAAGYFAPDIITKGLRGFLPGRSISGEFGMGQAPSAGPAATPAAAPAPQVEQAGVIPAATPAAAQPGGEQYLDPAVYGPIATAMGMGGAAPRPAARPVMGDNAFGVDPNAVRTNTVQRVTAPDGSIVYTNYAPADSAAARAPYVEPAPPRVGGIGGSTQARGVSGVVDSLIGLGAIRTARADQMYREKLKNDYQTAISTQLLKNQAARADAMKDVKVMTPGLTEAVISPARGTVTMVDKDGNAVVKPITAAQTPFSQQSVQVINRRLMQENPGYSLAQRRAAIQAVYPGQKIDDAWLR